jgi:hypothetical protein
MTSNANHADLESFGASLLAQSRSLILRDADRDGIGGKSIQSVRVKFANLGVCFE